MTILARLAALVLGLTTLTTFPSITQDEIPTPGVKGTIYPKDGKPIITENIWFAHYPKGWKYHTLEGAFSDPDAPKPYKVTIPMGDVAQIDALGGSDISVCRREGDALILKKAGCATNNKTAFEKLYVNYVYFNKIEKKAVVGYLPFTQVSRIVFGEHYGPYRKCKTEPHYFPPNYLFCPYHGDKTEWADVVK